MESCRHLSQLDVALRYRVTTGTIERWRRLGTGPKFLKIQSKVRYRIEDLVSFEEEQLRKSTSERVDSGGDQ